MMDYVLPYVDCNDSVWMEQYKSVMRTKNCLKHIDRSRFRPFNTLRYAFRSISQNLPFIDRIVLIVSTESQVPEWVNRETVRIVSHDEFMPEKHRPTFNSSAIESDMWRINGLSERFLYGNDDFFALRPLKETDFFENDLPRLTFEESDFHIQNLFRRCCRNGMNMAADAAGVMRSDPYLLLKPQHCMKGMRVQSMKEVGIRCADLIESTITDQRHWNNITGYIYQYFEYYNGSYRPFDVDFAYICISNDYKPVIEAITRRKAAVLCINDAGELDGDHYEEACLALCQAFEEILPDGCKYEK